MEGGGFEELIQYQVVKGKTYLLNKFIIVRLGLGYYTKYHI